MIHMFPLRVTLFLIMLLNSPNSIAKNIKYGTIDDISGNNSVEVSLIRGDEPIPAAPGMIIFFGDILILKTDDIIVKYCNVVGECEEVSDTKHFNFKPNEGILVTKTDIFRSSLASSVWGVIEFYATQAVSRGNSNLSKNPPSIILANMNKVPQSIFANKRSLAFQWRNGAAPFTIKIIQQEKLEFNAKTSEQYIQTNQINWGPGEYQVSIEDKYGRTESVNFYVVDRPEFAKQLQAYFSSGPEKNINQYTRLGTMAMVDGGRYSLEAYQQLLPINTQSSALTSLRKAIEAGEVFPAIKSEEVIQKLQN